MSHIHESTTIDDEEKDQILNINFAPAV